MKYEVSNQNDLRHSVLITSPLDTVKHSVALRVRLSLKDYLRPLFRGERPSEHSHSPESRSDRFLSSVGCNPGWNSGNPSKCLLALFFGIFDQLSIGTNQTVVGAYQRCLTNVFPEKTISLAFSRCGFVPIAKPQNQERFQTQTVSPRRILVFDKYFFVLPNWMKNVDSSRVCFAYSLHTKWTTFDFRVDFTLMYGHPYAYLWKNQGPIESCWFAGNDNADACVQMNNFIYGVHKNTVFC